MCGRAERKDDVVYSNDYTPPPTHENLLCPLLSLLDRCRRRRVRRWSGRQARWTRTVHHVASAESGEARRRVGGRVGGDPQPRLRREHHR